MNRSNNTHYSFFLCLLVIGFCQSCLHKNVMKGEADEVVKSFIHTEGDKNYLINVEYLFQVNSKESGSRGTFISGFNDIRVSVYDIQTGEMVSRKDLGKANDEDGGWVLGLDEQNLWVYSQEEGLHALSATTLELSITYDAIRKANPDLESQWVQAEFAEIIKFYGFDKVNKNILIKDKQANFYSLRSSQLKAEKVDFFTESYRLDLDYFAASGKLKEQRLYLKGDEKKEIEYNNQILNPDLSYLDAQLIMDQNATRIYTQMSQDLEALKSQINTDIAGDTDRKSIRNDMNKRSIERDIDRLEDDIQELQEGPFLTSSQVLTATGNDFFIFYRESTEKTAKVKIARVSLENGTQFTEKWDVVLTDIFFEASAAEEAEDEGFFTKGNPSYGYDFVDLVNGKLILIHTLQASCIDVETGQLLWLFRI